MKSISQGAAAPPARSTLARRYRDIRLRSEALTEPLSAEDMVVQAAPHASPTKWHLAHTTWFFETFVLEPHEPAFEPYSKPFRVLFNSYYKQVGDQHPRPRRGVLTRPGIGEVMAYRSVVDERIPRLIERSDERTYARIAPLIELGLQHEQQHQELLLMDIKVTLHASPLAPAYRTEPADHAPAQDPGPAQWLAHEGGVVQIGYDGDAFAYDHEMPRHRRFLEPFELADRLVTNAEFLEFVEDDGYERVPLWLEEGWTTVQEQGWHAPEYWRRDGDHWLEYTMDGLAPLDPHAPVCHVSFYEADAYARWAGARLPTESETEHACDDIDLEGNFLESGRLHPAGATGSGLRQAYGDAWEWTRSAYEPYPGYEPPAGPVGEYNGKFMCNQQVLRGGSCLTSVNHMRPTYRNFFHPHERWQVAGIRLARTPS